MEKLNEYLQQLLSKCGYELHLEPNKNPYVVTSKGNTDISNSPLPGAQINMMIFSLIPADVKQQLPSNSQIEFVHPHNLGDFTFLVKKSPAGFNVTVSPSLSGNSHPVSFTEESSQESQPTVSIADELNARIKQAEDAENKAAAQFNTSENYEVEEFSSDSAESFSYEEESSSEYISSDDYNVEVINETEISANEANSDESIDQSDEYSPFSKVKEVQENYSNSAETYDIQSNDFSQNYDNNSPQIMNNDLPLNNNTPINNQQNERVNTNFSASNVETNAPPAETPFAQQTVAPSNFEVSGSTNMQNNFQTQATVPQQQPVSQQQVVAQSSNAATANPQARAKMDALFKKMADMGASDLHMSVSMPPMVRKDGKIAMLEEGNPTLTPDVMKQLLTSIMPQKNIEEFEERNDTDFAYEIKGLARFRANIFMDRKGMGGVFRIIPSEILTAEDLGLSKAIMDLCSLSKGLVVVTGPTGSGKSTTLCAMVDSINKKREDHIITIEDPIEFTHENKKCLVNQREVHNHTDSFKDALRAALREDPDILLVGEMRDLETISIAIETAETGHLVFGTLHTTTAASTVDRIIDQFPADRQQQIRVMLSESLRGVIAQTLLPKIGGGRIAALEVLIVTPAISNLIREGKTFQIPSAMQTGKNKGMMMLNDSLMDLVNRDLVRPQDAYVKAVDKEGFEMLLQRSGKINVDKFGNWKDVMKF